MSGAGHLLSFLGTDTLPALDFIQEYYWGNEPQDYLLGGSVPATEHSVMCAGGHETEMQTFERLLGLYPTGIVSVVSDTWDLWKVCTQILPKLRDRILSRDGKLVIRPDSGNPADILCGDPTVRRGTPIAKGVIELLWDVFGGTTTRNGYRMLDSHIGAIYGDAINYDRAREIMARLAAKGFASGNVVFGVGSYSYQFVTRDTYGFAMKATWADIAGEAKSLFKKPVTDNGEKFSATGRLAVLRYEPTGELYVVEEATPEQEMVSLMQPRWENGEFLERTSISKIRQTLWA
jgi:nicotinamide phosphoribosyltransferase